MSGAKVYLTERIHRSISGLLDYMPLLQLFLNQNIQDVSAFRLLQSVNAICDHRDANKHPCTSRYKPFVFLKIVGFALLYKLSSFLADRLIHFHPGDRFVSCRPAGVQESADAYARFFPYFWLHEYDVLHKRCGRNYTLLCTISIGSAIHSHHYQPMQTYLELEESFSWV